MPSYLDTARDGFPTLSVQIGIQGVSCMVQASYPIGANHNTQAIQDRPLDSSGTDIADILVHYLEKLGVEYVFGVPGGAIEPLFDALARSERRGSVRPIVARHESGAAFMADGYYYHTGNLGVCCATTGPGVTNMITGIATSYANSIPVLIITAQTSLPTFGRGAVQESSCTGVNTIGMLEHCCRYNTMISHPDQFEYKLVSAIRTAFGPKPGPVHISVPMDVMRTPTSSRVLPFFAIDFIADQQRPHPDLIDELFLLLKGSQKSLFLIGDGCTRAISNIMTVACELNISVISTPDGKGLVNPFHSLYKGVFGFAGHDEAVRAARNPELEVIVCIGTLMSEWASNGWDPIVVHNKKVVHIDQSSHNFSQTPMARRHIQGDIATIFSMLCERITKDIFQDKSCPQRTAIRVCDRPQFSMENESAYNSDAVPIKPQRLMRELPNIFPPNTRYLADCGNSFAWAIHYLHPYDRRLRGARDVRGGLFRACMEFAPMGWAIGCAVGTAIALKDQPVVCITGDGSVLMNGQELSVAVQENLPTIFIILNDAALGMVKHGQQLTGGEPIAFELPRTDFVGYAKALGARAFAIHSVDELVPLKDELFPLHGPVVLDVYIDVEEVPPIAKRIKMLTGRNL